MSSPKQANEVQELFFYRGNSGDPANPQVQCPYCEYIDNLHDGFSLLAGGFNGIKAHSPEDVNLQECSNCKGQASWDVVSDLIKFPPKAPQEAPEYQLQMAIALRELMGDKLIGRIVFTPDMGTYPGGAARVTELAPDPAAPEIVFEVKHPKVGNMGIFFQELVQLIA